MLIRYLRKHGLSAFMFIILTVTSSVILAIAALHISPLFDYIENGDIHSTFREFLLIFVLYAFVKIADYHKLNAASYCINKIRYDVRNDLFDKVINEEPFEHNVKDSGEYVADFTNDITILEEKGLVAARDLIIYIVTIASSCGAIFTIDYRMSLLLLAGTATCIIIPFLMAQETQRSMGQFLDSFEVYTQKLKNWFASFMAIRNFAVEDKINTRFDKETVKVEESKFNAEWRLKYIDGIVGRIAWLLELAVLMIGLIGVAQQSISLGSVIAAYLLAGEIGQPLNSLADKYNSIKSIGNIEKKIETARKQISKIDKSNNLPVNIPTVELDKVTVSIDGQIVLKNISFKFLPGKRYLIIGKNGSGKSTISKFIKKYYKEWEGNAQIGNLDLHDCSYSDVSRLVSYSNESVAFLNDTILENIKLYQTVSNDEIESIAADIGFNLPLGRKLIDEGMNISSGEQRKIEIMRALIKNPQVMIFDEVVSTLDVETAYEIEKMILEIPDRTIIMISNAFSGSLIDLYDEIVMIDHGEIVASGKHSDLIKSNEEYRKIYEIRCGRSC